MCYRIRAVPNLFQDAHHRTKNESAAHGLRDAHDVPKRELFPTSSNISSGSCFGPANAHPQQKPDFGEYLNGLYGYAVVLLRNSTEAEDLVQETCLRALRGIDGLRQQGSVKSWLFTILRNIWLNQVRQRQASPEMIELDADGNNTIEPSDGTQDPHADYVNQTEREQLRAAIQQLPVGFREIIILREYEELSYQEIAALLDCPVGTVMSRLARARSRLRELLSGSRIAPPEQEKKISGTSGTAA